MPTYLGEITEIHRNDKIIVTSENKKITLDSYHLDLPYEKGDVVLSSGSKLLFLVPTENSKVISKIKDEFFEISSIFKNAIIDKVKAYIKKTDFSPETDRDKVLATFLNIISWKEHYTSGRGHHLNEITNDIVPKDKCYDFAKLWLKRHLFRQFLLWGLSEVEVEIVINDFTIGSKSGDKLDIEELILTLSEYPSRFLYIHENLTKDKIDHLVEIFECESISPSIIGLKKRLFLSASSYLELDSLTKKIIGKEINRLGSHGLIAFDDNKKVALVSTYRMEESVSRAIRRKISQCDYQWISKPMEILSDVSKLTPDQVLGVKIGFANPISIITGGPGTGKTLVIHSIIKEAIAQGVSYHVAAFTGKAVGRVKETAFPQAIETSTIDMMITRGPEHYKFNLLILEEASMITTRHIYRLFQKFSPLAYKIIIVGDLDQIPPLEKGQFFCSLLWSRRIPYIRLTQNFRTDKVYGGDIVRNAQKIVDPLRNLSQPIEFDTETPSFNILKGNMKLLRSILLTMIRNKSDVNDFTILTPYNEEVRKINAMFQEVLFEKCENYLYDPKTNLRWHVNDRIMAIKNDTACDLANGDLGRIVGLCNGGIEVKLDKDDNPRNFYINSSKENLSIKDNLKHSYCLTINKSQGSEYNVVVLYLTVNDADSFFLNLNLIYTAITRAKKMVWIICEDPSVLLHACNKRLAVPNDVLRLNIVNAFPDIYEGNLIDAPVAEMPDDCEYSDMDGYG